MIQTFKGFLFNRCERHIGTGRVKSGRLDWENWVMCFRTQSTRNLTWSGVIRDFPRPLWQQQYQWLEKHEPQDMFPTWLCPGRTPPLHLLPTLHPSYCIPYPHILITTPPIPTVTQIKQAKTRWQIRHWGPPHTIFCTSMAQMKCDSLGEETNLGLRAKNYFHNILAPLKVFHFSLSPWFRNLKV